LSDATSATTGQQLYALTLLIVCVLLGTYSSGWTPSYPPGIYVAIPFFQEHDIHIPDATGSQRAHQSPPTQSA